MAEADNEEQLLEYEEAENDEPVTVEAALTKKEKGDHASVHSSTFKDFLLKPELLSAIKDCAFEHPSEVQHECIPQAILGGDLVCQAKSGMGKTAVFVLSTLQLLAGDMAAATNPDRVGPLVLVLAHTRELAYQINKEYQRFSKFLVGIRSEVAFGGLNLKTQIATLAEKPQIVVGCAGRIKELIEKKHLDVSGVKHFVLDECDSLLSEADIRTQVQTIFKSTPPRKQVMMFSATLNKEVRETCKKFMKNPVEIYVDDSKKLCLESLKQYYVQLTEAEKNRSLVNMMDQLQFNQLIIFVSHVDRCKALTKILNDQKFPCIAIHGRMEQTERLANYSEFKDFKKRILVATELFARGMDIERVNIVVNYDMPKDTATYLHRVARAGRFGTKGLAVSMVSSPADAQVLNEVQTMFEVHIDKLPESLDEDLYFASA